MGFSNLRFLLGLLTLTNGAISCSDSTQFSGGGAPVDSASPSPEKQSSADATTTAGDADVTQKDSDAAEDDKSKPSSPNPIDPSRVNNSVTPNGPASGSDPNQLFAPCTGDPSKPIVANVFQIPIDSKNLPDFNNLNAVDEVCLSTLNISKREFSQGFPGITNLIEWFGLDIRFRVLIPVAGRYTFYLNSDDGSMLYIDDNLVISNDGLHEVLEKSTQQTLSAGTHDFHVKYFQGPRYSVALELFWKKPGQASKEYLPLEVIRQSP